MYVCTYVCMCLCVYKTHLCTRYATLSAYTNPWAIHLPIIPAPLLPLPPLLLPLLLQQQLRCLFTMFYFHFHIFILLKCAYFIFMWFLFVVFAFGFYSACGVVEFITENRVHYSWVWKKCLRVCVIDWYACMYICTCLYICVCSVEETVLRSVVGEESRRWDDKF